MSRAIEKACNVAIAALKDAWTISEVVAICGKAKAHLAGRKIKDRADVIAEYDLARAIEERFSQLSKEARRRKETWIAYARSDFEPSPRSNCEVCGKFRGVAQAHHVFPLALQFDRGASLPDHEHVWLCPTHHAMLHLLIAADDPSRVAQACDLADSELKVMQKLLRTASTLKDGK